MKKVFFSRPGTTCKIKEAIINDIINSKHQILLAMAYIDDEELISKIIDSNAKLKKVILNLDDVEKKIINYTSLFKGHFEKITKILGSNKGHFSTMHHKFLILDNTIWIGSYNLTTRASQRNWENMIRLNDLDIIQAYQEEFNHMWNTGHYLSSELNSKITYQEGKLYCKDCHEEIKDVLEHFLVIFDGFNYTLENTEKYYFKCGRDFLKDEIKCCNCSNDFKKEKIYAIGFNDHFGDGEERFFCPACFPKAKESKRLTKFPIFPLTEELLEDISSSYSKSPTHEIQYKLIVGTRELISCSHKQLSKALGGFIDEFNIGQIINYKNYEFKIINTEPNYSNNKKSIKIFLEILNKA